MITTATVFWTFQLLCALSVGGHQLKSNCIHKTVAVMIMKMEKQIEFQSSYYTILLFPNYYYYIHYTYCKLN